MNLLSGYVYFLYFVSVISSNVSRTENSHRNAKLLPLFNLVRFPNTNCTVGNESGVCLNPKECYKSRGIVLGKCAFGYGVCCMVRKTCGDRTSDKIVSFVNPSYPTSDKVGAMCIFTLVPTNPSICQIRLDFVQFNLNAPKNGICSNEENLEIFSNVAIPLGITNFCGKLSHHHVYVHLNENRDNKRSTIVLILRTISRIMGYTWSIKLKQINCYDNFDADMKAPLGCLQYFTASEGTISSFNYDAATKQSYWQNQNYAICIKRKSSDRCIRYSTGDQQGILLDKNGADCQTHHQQLDPLIAYTDSIWIPNSDWSTLLCGNINGFYTLTTKEEIKEIKSPYYIHFLSDIRSVNDGAGFSFNYKIEDTICKS